MPPRRKEIPARSKRLGVRKRLYGSEDFKKAIEAVKAGLMTFREAAKYYEVPRTTLQDSLMNVLCF